MVFALCVVVDEVCVMFMIGGCCNSFVQGASALMIACKRKHLSVAVFLIAAGAEVNLSFLFIINNKL